MCALSLIHISGHSFHHEIATAIALGLFGSVDANRGDAQLGWDTDQFPNSVEELPLIHIFLLVSGGCAELPDATPIILIIATT